MTSEIIEKPMSAECTMAQYEALSDNDFIENREYQIIDYPSEGITGSDQMAFALTCARLFPENTVVTYIGITNSTYTNGHIYQIKIGDSGTKSWQDITPITSLDYIAQLNTQNTFTAINTFNEEIILDKGLNSDGGIVINNSVLKTTDTTQDIVTQYSADEIVIEQDSTQYSLKLPNKTGTLVVDNDLVDIVNTVDENSNYYFAGATKTSSDKFSIVGGLEATSNGTGNIVIGAKADGPSNETNSDGTITPASAVVIGNYATTSTEALRAIVMGSNARAEAKDAIQLGMGTNSTENSVQFFNDNIYKKDTKTFTMQNLTVAGNDIYGLLKGEGAPAETLVGKVGQQYQDITNKKLYYCTTASSENNVYKWQLLQTEITQSCEETTSITGETAKVMKMGNIVFQSITFTDVTGNSEKTWNFPVSYSKLMMAWANNVQDGQSVNNGSGVITSNETSMTARICGSNSTVQMFAIGWVE